MEPNQQEVEADRHLLDFEAALTPEERVRLAQWRLHGRSNMNVHRRHRPRWSMRNQFWYGTIGGYIE